MKLIIVMFGGFFGALSRYALGEWVHTDNGFPLSTFIINAIGCFFLGWFLTYTARSQKIKPEISLLIGTGFIGSFTTFSTFSVETLNLLLNEFVYLAILYVLASIIVGLLTAYFGWKLAISTNKEGDAG